MKGWKMLVANVAVQVTRINNAITLANEAVTDANAATARAMKP